MADRLQFANSARNGLSGAVERQVQFLGAPRVGIWGAGAVGIGLAHALATAGSPITIRTRSETTRTALRDGGLRRSGLFGESSVSPDRFSVLESIDAWSANPPDFLLVCTKAFATQAIADQLEPIAETLREHTRLVLCQNGWGNDAPFHPFWPKERLLHASIITGFHLHSPNEVEITAHAAPIAIGNLWNESQESATPLVQAIEAGGIPCGAERDISRVLWAKMLYNCALNPLGALTERRYGELARDEASRAIMNRVIDEVFETLTAAGFRVSWPDASAYQSHFYDALIPPTEAHESSMLQDLRAGRKTEIEALCGAVEELARASGIDTPTVSALATLVRQAESSRSTP